MKIALIAPPYPLEEAPSPPLGITYVAAACEQAGAEVKIIDFIVQKYTPEKLEQEINNFRPDVIGTNGVTMNYKAAARILATAKRIDPSVITLFGGPHVTFDVDNTFLNYPETDIILIGEAEETIAELIPVLHDRSQWKTVKGIAYIDNSTVVKTDLRPLISDLDKLPLPARHLLPMSRYQALGFPVSIITSRGCPNKCIFCLGRKMVGFKVRHRSTRLVVDEIENIMSYGINVINIADDLFTASKNRVADFCDELKRRNINIQWSVFARVNTVDFQTLVLMKEAGCHTVSFGIESGNPEMLKRVRKGITLNQARDAIAACKKAGINAHASFMVGLPGETRETLNDSDEFSKELGIQYGYHFFAPFPGTTVRDSISDYDIEILTDDWDLYDADNVVVQTSSLNPEAMSAFVEESCSDIKKEWDELNRRYRENDVTAEEHFQVAGYHRMIMIYKILSEDLIEEYSEHPGNMDSALNALSKSIGSSTGYDSNFVLTHLKDLFNKHYIQYEETDDTTRFYWSHNNSVSILN